MEILAPITIVLFVVVSATIVLLVLVQRPQGGGLAGAFGGAGGGGTDTVFGGRVGDALTWATVIAFALYLLLAVSLQRIGPDKQANAAAPIGDAAGVGPDTDQDFSDAAPVSSPVAAPGVFTGSQPPATPPAGDGTTPPAGGGG